MKVKITIDCDNAAFEEPNTTTEIAQVLRELADNVESYDNPTLAGTVFIARDSNGNKVGEMKVVRS